MNKDLNSGGSGQKSAETRRGWDVFRLGEEATNPPRWLAGLASAFILAIEFFALATIAILAVRMALPVWSSKELDIANSGKEIFIAMGALIAAPFVIWRLMISHWQARAAQKSAAVAQEQSRIAQEVAITNLFTKAVEQLGATREIKDTREVEDKDGKIQALSITRSVPNIEVRLGAIAALERIAQDSDRDYWPVMHTLCAYIRENSREKQEPAEIANIRAMIEKERTDDQAKKLAAWDKADGKPRVDLAAALAVLSRRRILPDEEAARDAARDNPRVYNFQRLDLRGSVLRNAELHGLSFPFAQWGGADLRGAWFKGAQLHGASLMWAQLQGAWFMEAQLQGASLDDAQLKGAWFKGAQLQGASLIRVQLQGAWLEDAQLQGARLNSAQLQSASLYRVQLQGAWLIGAQLQGASLKEAQLQAASLDGANLQGTLLVRAQLQGASLREAQVWRSRGAPAGIELGIITDIKYDPVTDGKKSGEEFKAWRDACVEGIPHGIRRKFAFEQLGVLNPQMDDPGDTTTEDWWRQREAQCAAKRDNGSYKAVLAESFRSLLADGTAAPYIAKGLIGNGQLSRLNATALEQLAADIAASVKTGSPLPGALGLSESDLRLLNEILASKRAAEARDATQPAQ